MKCRLTLVFATLAALSLPPTAAIAQPTSAVPGLTLSFLQPTGTGTTASSFDIWLRLALAANANPLDIDGSNVASNFGIPSLALPTDGYDVNGTQGQFFFDTYSFGTTTVALECTGSFSCGSPEYQFTFNYCGIGAPCFLNFTTFSLAPGGFYDFLFGTYTPKNGNAPPGTYNMFNAHAALAISGQGHEVDAQGNTVLDINGDPVVHDLYNWSSIASTCANQDPSCEFSRVVTPTVVATPEPATLSLVALGLIGIVGVRRRRAA